MLTWVLLAVIAGLLTWVLSKPSGLPPGKWGFPLVGYVPLYTKDVNKIISDFRKKYGDIFTWRLGSHVLVGFCDYKIIKSIFNRPECQGRPYMLTFDILKFHSNTGLVNSVGDVWSQGRRFTLRHLKDLGMGKSSLEEVIQHEVLNLVDTFEKEAGKPIEISWSLNVAVLNVIWKLVANQRYDIHDEDIIKFNVMVKKSVDMIQSRCALLDILPFLPRILPRVVLNKVFRINVLYEIAEQCKAFVLEVIANHLRMFDPSKPRDYIDAYLLEVQKEMGTTDIIFKQDYLNLVTTLGDLFAAGSETTSSTLRWLIAILANRPEIQEKMHEEIDAVVPRDRPPSLTDKEKLPYTEAVLCEVLRYSSLMPLGFMHATTEDIQVGEYHIPKNTTIFASARSCHRDSKYFEKPDQIYPGHFLDKDGKFLSKKEGFMPFSLGRRKCLGERLARMELFLFASCLLQRFWISAPEGSRIPLETEPFQPLLNFIMPYEVVFTKRE